MSLGYDLGFMGYKWISAIIFGEYMDEFDKNLTRDVFLRNMLIWRGIIPKRLYVGDFQVSELLQFSQMD